MWWDDETIQRTVTLQFVRSHLHPGNLDRLDRPPGFGDGLTDGTYWEWIDEKAKRLFLILLDLGLPDQIFGILDDSWDDADLPVAPDQLERLGLCSHKDAKLERRFYRRQWYYLLKPIQEGEHVVYEDMDVVPLDVVEQKLDHNRYLDKVVLPNQPGMPLCRRCIPLGPGPGMGHDGLLYQVNLVRRVQHSHVASYWASYVYQGHGFVLFTPVSEFSLKSLLASTPATVKHVPREQRTHLILEWVRCLVEALCSVHDKGFSLGNIRPSTVHFTGENRTFLTDISRLGTDLTPSRTDQTPFDKESYDYIAPEQRSRANRPPVQRMQSLGSPTGPPPDLTFSISRRGTEPVSSSAVSRASQHMGSGPPAPHMLAPYIDEQAADVFSLGCVILELLGHLLKKPTKAFASHRAAKHKMAGRGGAVPDSSFHKNIGQVESWMAQLAKEASRKDETASRAINATLHVVERMLALHPAERPSAHQIQTALSEAHLDVAAPWRDDRGPGIRGSGLSPVREAPRGEACDTLSISTGRSGGSRGSHSASSSSHRTGSGSSGAWVSDPGASAGSGPGSPVRRLKAGGFSSGLRAIRNLRIKTDRSKPRPQSPQTPVSA